MSELRYFLSINGLSQGPMTIQAAWEAITDHFTKVRDDEIQRIILSRPSSGASWPIVGRKVYWEALGSEFDNFLRYLGL